MTLYRATGRLIWTLKVPTIGGDWLSYSTATKHHATARRMERMIEHMGSRGERAWDLINMVHAGTFSVSQLFDRYCLAGKDLGELRASLHQIDLAQLPQSFLDAAHCTPDTKAHYKALIRRVIPEGLPFPAQEFTGARVQKAIDEMDATAATKRKAGAALRAFGNWLVRRGLIRDNPLRQVKLPKQPPARALFLETADAKRLADKQISPYRELSALLAGTGIEVSVALSLCVRDIDTRHREIRAKGTKTHSRDRIVRVADWAWPYVKRALRGKENDDRLFDGIPDRWVARDMHFAATQKLEQESPVFAGYTMRDHRHTYAVRAIRAGAPADLIARQLGHANAMLVLSVYGRFQPSQNERDRWERAAVAMDRKRGTGATTRRDTKR